MTLATSVRNATYIRFVTPLVAALPAWLAYGFALVYADFRIRLSGVRLQSVILCLEQVMGSQLSPKQRTEIARNYFRNRACVRVDAMRLTGNGQRLLQLVTINGEEFVREALDEGKGVIMCSAHYGSVRACAAILGARGFPIILVAGWSFPRDRHPGGTERMYQYAWKPIEHHIRRSNITVWESSISMAVEAAAHLRENDIIFTLIDNGPSRKNQNRAISLDFLGGRASILPGPAAIAKLTGAPLLMAYIRRTGDWRHLVLEILPRTPVVGDGSSTMQGCMKEVENIIRRDPAQWELWNMRPLVRLGLYPKEKAVAFYKSHNIVWEEI